MWCTYDTTNIKMFCTVCLPFFIGNNLFTSGMYDQKHIKQKISEHKSSKVHNHCCEDYFMHSQNRDVSYL